MSDLEVVKEMLHGKELSSMSLDEIADIIRKDWKKVYFGAVPYLDALGSIDSSGMFMNDPWQSIVAYFLGNANTWRGPVAKEVKAELKKRLKKNKMARLKKIATTLREAAKKPYRVIVIDSKNKKVYEDEASGLSDLQKFVGGYIEIAHEWTKGKSTDTLFVNEEGLLEMPDHFFEFDGAHQPFAGSAVVVGANHKNGDSVDAASTLAEIKSKVKFVSLEEVRRKYRQSSSVKVVHNKLLGGWFVVKGPHQTPISGRFDSKQEALDSLKKNDTKFVIKDGESFSQLLPRLEKLVKSLSKEALMGNARVHVSGGNDDYITRKAVGYLENNGILVGWDEPKTASSRDDILKKIADAIKNEPSLMNMRKHLESLFKKKDIDYDHSPFPHFSIKHQGETIVIVNKKYSDEGLVVGDYAVGYLG